MTTTAMPQSFIFDPTFLGMGLFVLAFAWYRFDRFAGSSERLAVHGSTRSFTTLAEFTLGAVLYALATLIVYATISLLLTFEEVHGVLGEVLSLTGIGLELPKRADGEAIRVNSTSIWAASLLTVTLQVFPVLRGVELRLRAGLQRLAHAPERLYRLVETMKADPVLLLHQDSLSEVRDRFQPKTGAWRTDMAYRRGSDPERRHLDSCYVLVRLQAMARQDPGVGHFLEQHRDVVAHISEQLEGGDCGEATRASLLQLAAASVLATSWTEDNRCDRLAYLGFRPLRETLGFDLWSLALTFLLTFFAAAAVLATLWLALGTTGLSETPLGADTMEPMGQGLVRFQIEMCLRIAALHSVAIASALWLRSRLLGSETAEQPWRQQRLGPVPFVAVEAAGGWLVGAGFVLAVNLLQDFPWLPAGPAGLLLLDEMSFAGLIGVPAGAAAVSFFILSMSRLSPLKSAVIQGTVTCLATLLVLLVLLGYGEAWSDWRGLGIAPADTHQLASRKLACGLIVEYCDLSVTLPPITNAAHLAIVFGAVVALVVGAAIGYIMPIRYRMRAAARRSIAAARIAVVGAGISGLACAQHLQRRGFSVVVFERELGPGGRLRTEQGAGRRFDIGAQYFDAPIIAGDSFDRQVKRWVEAGCARERELAVVRVGAKLGEDDLSESPRRVYQGVPYMAAVVEPMARSLDIRFHHGVEQVRRSGEGWRLLDADRHELESFRYVVLAVPPNEVVRLLDGEDTVVRSQAVPRAKVMAPVWSTLVVFDQPLSPADDGGQEIDMFRFDKSEVLFSATLKPSDAAGPEQSWVLHARTDWSAGRAEASSPGASTPDASTAGVVAREMLEEFWRRTALPRQKPSLLRAHYIAEAIVGRFEPVPGQDSAFESWFLFDERGLGACGDWCVRRGVGHAWSSGHKLAQKILEHHDQPAGS